MKKLILSYLALCGELNNEVNGQAKTGKFNNLNLNALGSNYAAATGRAQNASMGKAVRADIYDAFPEQFLDLLLLNMQSPEKKPSDEFFYQEAGFGREAIVIGTIGVNIASGATQTIPVVNIDQVSKDIIVLFPDGTTRGTVTAVDKALSTITVKAETGKTLPLLATTASAKTMAFLSPVEADAAEDFATYFRMDTFERSNYVQMISMAHKMGRMEIYKHQNSALLKKKMEMERKRLLMQMKVSISNIYWNGNKAEVTLADGTPAKTAGGIFPIMKAAGCVNNQVAVANLKTGLEELVLDTEFGQYGKKRFLYGTPRAILKLSQEYKSDLTRYTPGDKTANLTLNQIDFGSTVVVLVPIKRFEEASCFSPDWKSRMFLLDQESIVPCYCLEEESGTLINRQSGGGANNSVTSWWSASFSIEFRNPLASGWLDITDLF